MNADGNYRKLQPVPSPLHTIIRPIAWPDWDL